MVAPCGAKGETGAMPQLQLPIFPQGLTSITEDLAFQPEDGKVVYFHGLLPVFQHDEKDRSEEHTSELQSRQYLVCRLLLEKKKKAKAREVIWLARVTAATPSRAGLRHRSRHGALSARWPAEPPPVDTCVLFFFFF